MKIDKPTLLSSIALIISVCTLFFSYWTYTNTTQPHTEFEEIESRLNALDERLQRYGLWLIEQEGNESYYQWALSLMNASIAYDNAYNHWDNYNFGDSKENISMANYHLSQIDYNAIEFFPFLWVTILVIIIVAISLIILFKAGIIKFKK
jgi:hypothetical protein